MQTFWEYDDAAFYYIIREWLCFPVITMYGPALISFYFRRCNSVKVADQEPRSPGAQERPKSAKAYGGEFHVDSHGSEFVYHFGDVSDVTQINIVLPKKTTILVFRTSGLLNGQLILL